MSQEVIGFEVLKDLYAEDDDFKETWTTCKSKAVQNDFHIYDGFFLKIIVSASLVFLYVKC